MGSFYFDTLNADQAGYREGEPYQVYDSRRQLVFEKSLQEYPLLSRIHEFYRDACFASDEIVDLESELHRVEKLPFTEDGASFLNGMLQACRTARSEEMGIRLLSS